MESQTTIIKVPANVRDPRKEVYLVVHLRQLASVAQADLLSWSETKGQKQQTARAWHILSSMEE